MDNTSAKRDIKYIVQILLELGVLAFILGWCFIILSPFIFPIIWGLVISITVYPMFAKLKTKLGGRGKLASTLITIVFLAILLVPTFMLSGSLIDGVRELKAMIDEGRSPIPPPGEHAKTLPAFAQPLVAIWQEASQNLQAAVSKHPEGFQKAGLAMLSFVAKTGAGILSFLISIILAGVFLAYAKEGGNTLKSVFVKLAGKQGEELAAISEATIRSVVKGILGVAIVQTLMSGIGFVVVGIPAAGLWTLFCLIFAIIQVGVGPVMIPMIIYVFNTADLTTSILFLIWGGLTLISDNILKPLLLGRGAPVPMLVVFLGAIGGFIATGFLGLFLGAVILSLGYKLYESWMNEGKSSEKSDLADIVRFSEKD
ncbi:Predicted PurR-regulated permease PerM [Chryseolinea serpens]|uniref:Predicted PurR-regulated permease PerM n=1 Tax=Chryseolinea serpens TaxID=947013 RepID=A0A1M5RGK1_9BACT|nr:AI-2E family transporter [Chryseolinea serpens]SHH25318.1 Predicted PurR-regulated permease PerM [Chryseolinea serpens]